MTVWLCQFRIKFTSALLPAVVALIEVVGPTNFFRSSVKTRWYISYCTLTVQQLGIGATRNRYMFEPAHFFEPIGSSQLQPFSDLVRTIRN